MKDIVRLDRSLKAFLDRYPRDDAPGQFTSKACVCGHLYREHSYVLSVCMAIAPTQLMRADGEPTTIERTYCPCLEWRE